MDEKKKMIRYYMKHLMWTDKKKSERFINSIPNLKDSQRDILLARYRDKWIDTRTSFKVAYSEGRVPHLACEAYERIYLYLSLFDKETLAEAESIFAEHEAKEKAILERREKNRVIREEKKKAKELAELQKKSEAEKSENDAKEES